MATIKFKTTSPYIQSTPIPPADDYLYQKYLDNLSLKTKKYDEPVARVAIFGLGRAGTIHLASVVNNPRVKLAYIVDNVESSWPKLKKYWHLDDDVMFLNDKQSDRVYKDSSVDIVIVASPTYTHEEIVIKSLESKKGVFCEKPIAETRESIKKCFQVAIKQREPLFAAFNRRFDPSYSSVRDRVLKGEIGHVHTIKTVSRDSPLPSIEFLKHSGGIFHDCMVHDIDVITWILGEYPTKVAVQAHAHIPEIKALDDVDTVAACFYFPSGTLGIVDLSRNSNYGYDQRLEVFGPGGMIRADNEQPNHCVTTQYGFNGLNSPSIWYSFASRFHNGYINELEHFLDVYHGKCESSVKAKDILAVSKVATACEESAKTGKMIDIEWTFEELSRDCK